MRRPLIITIGIVIILMVMGIWVYLIIFGTPKAPRDVFTNLGVISTTTPTVQTLPGNTNTTSSTQLALRGSKLQQLSTRDVAGFGFVGNTGKLVRYVEKGTGYIYEVDLTTGSERQISLTTLPKISKALFSPLGTTVALTSYDGYQKDTSIASVPSDGNSEIELHNLPLNADNIAFKDDNTLYYTLGTGAKTVGYSFSMKNFSSTEVFAFNAGDMRAQWGGDLSQIYLMTKPALSLEGYVYTISKSTINPVTLPEPGLTAFMNNSYIVTSYASGTQYISQALHNLKPTTMPILMLPQKCAFISATDATVLCGAPTGSVNNSYLEDWYTGALNSNDQLWVANLSNGKAQLLANLATLSGRMIDVSELTFAQDGTYLLFSNKIDGALWLYRMTN